MSKKKNRTGNSGDLIKNIGKRLGGDKNKDDEKEKNSSSNNENQDIEEKKVSDDIEEEKTKHESSNDNDQKDSWFDEKKPYRSSFIVKPKMEINFEDCKRKFRKELRMNLSKQNAIELGWLLLKNLDESFFDEVRKNYSPDDDLVESLKEVLIDYY